MGKHVRFRHHLTFAFLRPFFHLFLRIRYNFRRRFFKLERKRPYLILYNHATNVDAYAVACSFRRPLYFVATEHLMSVKHLSWLVDYLIAPIPIQKNKVDLRSVREIVSVAKEGGTIALSPEGNSTLTGENPYMYRSIRKLVRLLRLPVVFCHITGNYMSNPRWGVGIRKNQLTCEITDILEPSVYLFLTDDEVFQLIKEKLYVNAYQDQMKAPRLYPSKEPALYLERVLLVCPRCRSIDRLYSIGNRVVCKSCDFEIALDEYGFFTDNDFDFKTVIDWDNWQKPLLAAWVAAHPDAAPLFAPAEVRVLEHVQTGKRYSYKRDLGLATITLTTAGFVLEFADRSLMIDWDVLEELAMADKNQLLFYRPNANTLIIKGKDRFSPYKYVIARQKLMAMRRGVEPEYLGI